MRQISTLMLAVSFSFVSYGQETNSDRKLSLGDSILLNDFWANFRLSVKTKDKEKLEAMCEFPFYCRPCTDDTTLKPNDHITIRVTKQIFTKSQYKLFFAPPFQNEVSIHKAFDKKMFIRVSDGNKPSGFKFSYTIVAPSKNWEGLQGFIFLEIKNGRYKITGIDTVPKK